ncbi:MAG: pseudouridine synthase, partial [Vicinamibacteria bacterium]|nr:pseudouridine synthase [Vicinamibacteria bacterium]
VMDLVPSVAGLFPVGRLDVGTEGLIILTNDGAFAERVSHPRFEVPRVYHAKVRGVLDEPTLQKLTDGVYSDGERLRADHARILEAGNNSWLELRLHEGKNREVRRLLEAAGHPVSKLRRVSIGPVTDRGLEVGEFRQLLPAEIAALLKGGPRGPRPKRAADAEAKPPVAEEARKREPRREERRGRPPGFAPKRPGTGRDAGRSATGREDRTGTGRDTGRVARGGDASRAETGRDRVRSAGTGSDKRLGGSRGAGKFAGKRGADTGAVKAGSARGAEAGAGRKGGTTFTRGSVRGGRGRGPRTGGR